METKKSYFDGELPNPKLNLSIDGEYIRYNQTIITYYCNTITFDISNYKGNDSSVENELLDSTSVKFNFSNPHHKHNIPIFPIIRNFIHYREYYNEQEYYDAFDQFRALVNQCKDIFFKHKAYYKINELNKGRLTLKTIIDAIIKENHLKIYLKTKHHQFTIQDVIQKSDHVLLIKQQ